VNKLSRKIQLDKTQECNNCGLCIDACKKTNKEDAVIFISAIEDKFIPLACLECANAFCVKACPTTALQKDRDSNLVLLNKEECLQCGFCVLACPFGLMGEDKRGFPLKCDGCPEYEKAPCVLACPLSCLEEILT